MGKSTRKNDGGSSNAFNRTCLKYVASTSAIIVLYFLLSISLTFYQRWLLQNLQFPLFVTSGHLVFKFFCAWLLRSIYTYFNGEQRVTLGWSDYTQKVGPVGLAGGFDVAFSNWGLELITVSLYTMTKSTSVVFILFFALIFKLEKRSWRIVVIVLMMAIGLVMFTYKSTQFHLMGFLLVLLATISSGLRWTLAQMLMQKSKLGLENPIDVMYHVQPWMLLMVLPLAIAFEGVKIALSCKGFNFFDDLDLWRTIWTVLAGATLAFFMELAEYLVVATTSSLTLSIIGIVKEVSTLVLAVKWNGDKISVINVLGLLTCLGGITLHTVSKTLFMSDESDCDASEEMGMDSCNGDPSELRTPLLLAEQSIHNLSVDDSDSEASDVLFSVMQRRTNAPYEKTPTI